MTPQELQAMFEYVMGRLDEPFNRAMAKLETIAQVQRDRNSLLTELRDATTSSEYHVDPGAPSMIEIPIKKREYLYYPYFKWEGTADQFSCPCCNNLIVDDVNYILNFLVALRIIHGYPVTVTSFYRCNNHNAEVGGEPGSTSGTASHTGASARTRVLSRATEHATQRSAGTLWHRRRTRTGTRADPHVADEDADARDVPRGNGEMHDATD